MPEIEEIEVKKGHGGRRAGSGRKKGSGLGLTERIQFCVTPRERQAYLDAGGTAWLRLLLEHYAETGVVMQPDAKSFGSKKKDVKGADDVTLGVVSKGKPKPLQNALPSLEGDAKNGKTGKKGAKADKKKKSKKK